MKVVKRDGTIVDYDRSKIVTAIEKANAEVPEEERLGRDRIDAIIDHIEALKRPRMLVEDIQDLVEQGLEQVVRRAGQDGDVGVDLLQSASSRQASETGANNDDAMAGHKTLL